jgi:glycosyltransferase involved in cell wall biosynthesis
VICAVVPALDEAPRIARVVRTMPRCVERIVVIDDGSRDDTGAIALAADARVEVLRHERPLGVGASIGEGCVHARARGASIVVVLAGDGQMDPADLPAIIAPIAHDEADFVKGNRLAWPGGAVVFPLPRLIGIVAFAAATRLATGLAIDDAQCGYVAIGPRALAAIECPRLWPRFGYPNDLLGALARLGLRVVEAPVRPIYGGEQSKLRLSHLPGVAFVIARAAALRITC